MDDAAAIEALQGAETLVREFGTVYDNRWGRSITSRGMDNDALAPDLAKIQDEVRQKVRFARDVVAAMGELEIARRIKEDKDSTMTGHGFQGARVAILEAMSILAHREKLEAIVGPTGPRLVASELNPLIWGSAAALWDHGHVRQAVQTAATALEGELQGIAGPDVSGENLAQLLAIKPPTDTSPRLRIRGIEPDSKAWTSAHEGAAAMVRGAF